MFAKELLVKQESFHAHFTEGLLQGESNWGVRFIDPGVSAEMLSTENLTGNTNWKHFSQMN